jgi:hypothetical protein
MVTPRTQLRVRNGIDIDLYTLILLINKRGTYNIITYN